MSKLAKFRSSRHGEPKHNPPLLTDVAEYLIPGFAAFALDRVLARFIALQIEKRAPKYAKHAGAIAAAGAFAVAWWGAHKVKFLEKYHHPIVIGTGLAALQSLIQLYAPKLGAFISDPIPALTAPKATAKPLLASAPTPVAAAPIPQGFKPTTANEWYTYNDSFDAGGYKGKVEAAAPPVPGEEPPDTDISDLLDNSDLQLDNSDMGLFS